MPTIVTPDVLDVLASAEVDGTNVVLPDQLDRPLYSKVAKVLTAAGGRWDRRAGATVFPEPAGPLLEAIILTGEVTDARREFDAFYTPLEVASAVVDQAFAGLDATPVRVLEPSAGGGALVYQLLHRGATVVAYDVRTDDWAADPPSFCTFTEQDFLTVDPTGDFDLVVMNPPFSRQQDMAHVLHALDFLKPGGRLVAIMSPAWTYRSTALAKGFRARVEAEGAEWRDLPRGTFRSSGTEVLSGVLEVVV
jgi:predicted RNA methylase